MASRSPTLAGLSPRVRGNPLGAVGRRTSRRSIPAGAGEPFNRAVFPNRKQVYPRGCGGTPSGDFFAVKDFGLSPRVRGNLSRDCRQMFRVRSIPAGAGEPSADCTEKLTISVYPRGCGGTPATVFTWGWLWGLSPRVRGNLPRLTVSVIIPRSIPAGAGEPMPGWVSSALIGVYPRGCGGTDRQPIGWRHVEGLSPRVRGNLPRLTVSVIIPRSIPAGAGEP